MRRILIIVFIGVAAALAFAGPGIGITIDATLHGTGASTNPLGVNTSTIQARVSSSCTAGSSIRVINADGTVTCQTSSGITNSAGANVVTKSDGTNLVASLLTDDGSTLSYNGGWFTVASSNGNTDVWGILTGHKAFALPNQTYVSPTATSANDYDPWSGGAHTPYLEIDLNSLSSGGTFTLTGIKAGTTGEMLYLWNGGGCANLPCQIVFMNQSSSSLSANRFWMPNGKTFNLTNNNGILLYYNGGSWSTFAGETSMSRAQQLSLEPSTSPTSLAAGSINDNYNPWSGSTIGVTSHVRLSMAGTTATITGISAAGAPNSEGRQLLLENTSDTGTILFTNKGSTSSGPNQILTPTGDTVALGPHQTMLFDYDLVGGWWRVTATTAPTNAFLGLYSGTTQGFADELQVSTVRKNVALNSDALGTDVVNPNVGWYHFNYVSGSTLVYTTSSQTSPRNMTETVGQITCTNGTAACTTGGSDLRMIDTSTATGVSDLRSTTWTLSVWVKEASGTNSSFTLQLGRYNDNDQRATTCSVNSTSWTRCSLTTTFSSTSYTDNSELRAYLLPKTTTAHYVYAAQVEQHFGATPYQRNDANADTTVSSSTLSTFAPMARWGQTMQDPNVWARYFDNSGNYYGLRSVAPATGSTVCREGESCTTASASTAVMGEAGGNNAVGIYGKSNSFTGALAGKFDGNVTIAAGKTLNVDNVTATTGPLTIGTAEQISITTSSNFASGIVINETGFGNSVLEATGGGDATVTATSGNVNITAGSLSNINVTGTWKGSWVSAVLSPSALSTPQNDWNPTGLSTAIIVRATTSGFTDLTGLAGGTGGRTIILVNIGSNPIRLRDQDPRSSAANRFILGNGHKTMGIPPNNSVALLYDGTQSRWLIADTSWDPSSNGYGSTHGELAEEFMFRIGSVATNTNVGDLVACSFSGTGAACGISDNAGAAGRPGIQEMTTGTTSTGRAAWTASLASLEFTSASYDYQWVGGLPTLSTATDGYAAWTGLFQIASTVDQANGCYVLSDERQAASAPTTGSRPTAGTYNLACVCANSSTRTEYPMDGSTVDDSGNATVSQVASALTWPSTGVLNVEVVTTTSTRAEFWINGTLSCVITTHIPSAASRTAGPGAEIMKSVGTTARPMDHDYMYIGWDLTTARP